MAQHRILTLHTAAQNDKLWFGSKGTTLYKNSSGGSDTDNSDSNGNPKSVSVGTYKVTDKSGYWASSGNPFNNTGMKITTTTTISNHYWQTSVWGCDLRGTAEKVNEVYYCPILDPVITSCTFDWERFDCSKKSKGQHIRIAAMGLIYRTGDNSVATRGFSCPTSETIHNYDNKDYNHTSFGHNIRKTFTATKQIVGFYCCLEHQGNSAYSTREHPYIKIKNLTFQHNGGGDLILFDKQRHTSFPRDLSKIYIG